MGFMSRYTGTAPVDLGDGYTVTVLRYLPGDKQEEAEAARTRAVANVATSGDQPTVAVETSPNIAQYTTLLLDAAIVAWNLTDDRDQLLPLAPAEQRLASIRGLPSTVRAKIRDQIEANSKAEERTPEEQRTFRGAGDVGVPVGEGRPAGTPGSDAVGNVLDPARSEGAGTPVVA